jgi:hypothetical protein
MEGDLEKPSPITHGLPAMHLFKKNACCLRKESQNPSHVLDRFAEVLLLMYRDGMKIRNQVSNGKCGVFASIGRKGGKSHIPIVHTLTLTDSKSALMQVNHQWWEIL